MSDLLASALKNSLGLQLLHWAVSQSDIWHLAHRCSELAHKINEPLEKSAYVLNNLLTMDEDDVDCIGIRDLHMQQMHFDDEEDYNEEGRETRRHNRLPATSTATINIRNYPRIDAIRSGMYVKCNFVKIKGDVLRCVK